MSRIGKLPIKIPADVNISWKESEITVKGKFGTLSNTIPEVLQVNEDNGYLLVSLKDNNRTTRSLHGLYRTLVNNMVVGVSEQFKLTLTLKGVGYRASVQAKELTLNLGYSHPIKIEIPEDISIEVVQNTTLNLTSCNKANLGLFAAQIRSWRPPEPYKGKGIIYAGEIIRRKAGKSGKK